MTKGRAAQQSLLPEQEPKMDQGPQEEESRSGRGRPKDRPGRKLSKKRDQRRRVTGPRSYLSSRLEAEF